MAGSLVLWVDAAGVDDDELDRMARRLMAELNESELAVASIPSAPAPAGTKAADVGVAGTLLVQVLPEALPALLAFLRSWSRRRTDRTVKVKATGAAGSVDIEYPAGELSERELQSLITRLARSMASPPAAG